MAGRADSRHPVAFSIYLSLVGGASATPTLENGVLHVNYQQVQVMSAILMVGLSPLTKASATAGESQASMQSAQGQLPSGTYWYNQAIVFGNNTDTFKLISYQNNGHEAIKFVNSTNAPRGSEVTFPRTIAQDLDTANVPFIDMSQVKAETTALSGTLSAHEDAGATYDFADQNKKTITYTKGEGLWHVHRRRHQREEGVERRERRGRSASGIGDSRAMLRERGWRNAASVKGFASAEGPGRGPFCVCFSSCCQAVGVSQ